MKLLLISGHGANDPGACSSYGIEREETRKVVNKMVELFKGYEIDVDVYNQSRNAYADVCNGTVQVNFANYDYVFEVHFNSASFTAHGTEIWVTPSESSIVVEQKIVNKLSAVGFTNRGIKREYFAVINAVKNKGVSSALVEVCFISNSSDMNLYKKKFNDVCKAMVDGIAEGFGLKKIAISTPTPQPTEPNVIYRVKLPNGTQIGAFRNLESAKNLAKQQKANVYRSTDNVMVASYSGSTSSVIYRVKSSSGVQLGAFSILNNAKKLAQEKQAIVYDQSGRVVVSYVPTKKYLNLNPNVASWRVYPTNVAPIVANACGSLAPKTYGGLSYEILDNPQADVYTIMTSNFGKVNIYAPKDNDSSITTYPKY